MSRHNNNVDTPSDSGKPTRVNKLQFGCEVLLLRQSAVADSNLLFRPAAFIMLGERSSL